MTTLLIQRPDDPSLGSQNMQVKNLGGRVGTYAISTVDFDSWMNEPVVNSPMKTRKVRGNKEVIHRIFADCAKVVLDPFWIDKFNNAAIGKFPSKFSFNDGILTFRKGTKNPSIEVSNNPAEAAIACMEFFRSNAGIFSPLDEQNSAQLQHARSHGDQQQLSWADANKKVQECMLSYYVADMKRVMTLKDSEAEQLRQTIRLGISNKYFGKHNIRVEGNRIHTIGGLVWNNESREFYIDPELKPVSSRPYSRKKDGPPAIDPSQKDMIPQFSLKWKKYVESLDKKIIQNSRRQRRVVINQMTTGGNGGPKRLHLVTSPTLTTDVLSADATSPKDYTCATDETDE